jgi:enamine deaminase RidA (YjgF/YER057c/UK114 family)
MGVGVPLSRPSPRHARTIEPHGCSIVLRRVVGPAATEVYLHCRPPATAEGPRAQAAAIYGAIQDALEAEGGDFASVVVETVFLRDLAPSLESVREARRTVVLGRGGAHHAPATTEIEQPPLDPHACLEVMVQAVLPHAASALRASIESRSTCRCAECARAHGLLLHLGDETRFHAGGLCGTGSNAHEQTLDMFGRAEQLLQQAGMEFSDVVRTWIHLRHMERDYPQLNRARREFFAARGIQPVPASTGIGGGVASGAHDLCLGVYAVKSRRPLVRGVMTSPTLNEAADYGADFARGIRAVEVNKVALHVSGTASIDEHGRTVHTGDLDHQVERMLRNVGALLDRQGATFGDVVSAITYLKHPEDAERLQRKFREAGFEGFPHALVAAEICRPELLCETEVLAALPLGTGTDGQA